MPRQPMRERSPAELRQQAEEYRTAAKSASPSEVERLLRVAQRYEELAVLKEMVIPHRSEST